MANGNLSKVLWRLSLPIIFVEASETFDHLIDTVFLARVGVTELGAIAVTDSVLLFFLVLPLGLVDGIQILTARRAGQRRPEAVGAIFSQGLILVLLICLALTVLLKLLSPVMTYWFVTSDEVGVLLDDYLQIEAYGLVFIGATFAYSALLVSIGRSRALVPATLLLVGTDVLLNYLFIFGNFGLPALGMRGAAVGSVGAEIVTFLFLTAYLWRLDTGRYRFFRWPKFERRTVQRLSLLASPIALQGGVETLRWFLFFLILESMSTEALAIGNVVFTCYIVFLIPTEGLCEATCSLVSRYIGRDWSQKIDGILRHAISGALLVTGPFVAVALLAPQWLVSVFFPEAGGLEQSSISLQVVALAMLIAIPAEIWFTAVIGTGDTAAAFVIEVFISFAMLGFAYIAAVYLAWPVATVWLALPLACLVNLVFSYGWMKSGIWKRIEA
ncbi:MATE family efflux transporter [Pseudomonas sp. LFM046]|uniref:MATE family efflux transporter n=1 Tax=Pseudomonas sp. LFM046 TaxID=1608357 RepID=UPI0005CFBA82|nr:MATE family efflux transporter [Pseudomonas sp. LFM046]